MSSFLSSHSPEAVASDSNWHLCMYREAATHVYTCKHCFGFLNYYHISDLGWHSLNLFCIWSYMVRVSFIIFFLRVCRRSDSLVALVRKVLKNILILINWFYFPEYVTFAVINKVMNDGLTCRLNLTLT